MMFRVEYAIALTGHDNYRDGKGPIMRNAYAMNNAVEFAEYLSRTIEYFCQKVEYENDVEFVQLIITIGEYTETRMIELYNDKVRVKRYEN